MIQVLLTIDTPYRIPTDYELFNKTEEHLSCRAEILKAEQTTLTEEQVAQTITVGGGFVVTREQIEAARARTATIKLDTTKGTGA